MPSLLEPKLLKPNLLKQIREDHVSATRVLELIEQEIATVRGEEMPDTELLADAMHYMVNYSDTLHHPREDSLFALLAVKDPDLEPRVESMRAEHVELSSLSNAFLEIVRAVEYGGFVPRADVIERSTRYVSFLRNHMSREEEDLLKKAAEMLSDQEIADIENRHATAHDPLKLDSLKTEYNALYRALGV